MLLLTSCASQSVLRKPSQSSEKPSVTVHLERLKNNEWLAHYEVDRPTQYLKFIRQDYRFRAQQWESLSPDIQIIEKAEKEYIVSKSGAPFTKISFKFKPYHTVFDREYDFSFNFSDGGMAIYAGHFSVFTDWQPDNEKPSKVKTKYSIFSSHEYILHFSGDNYERLEWEETDEESSYFIATPKQSDKNDKYNLIIEPSLPEKLKNHISSTSAKIMDLYEKRFGFSPPLKPLLFFTNNIDPKEKKFRYRGSYSHGMVQFSFVGSKWNQFDAEGADHATQFLGHELAHFWNAEFDKSVDSISGWMKEGGANAFRDRASVILGFVTPAKFLEWQNDEIEDCILNLKKPRKKTELTGIPLSKALYSCGSLAALVTETIVKRKNPSVDLFSFWSKFMKEAQRNGYLYSRELYFKTLDLWADNSELARKLENWIYSEHKNPEQEIYDLLKSAGLQVEKNDNHVQFKSLPTF